MPKEKDPAEVVETLRQSIKVSQRGERHVRAHRFKELSVTRHCQHNAGSW